MRHARAFVIAVLFVTFALAANTLAFSPEDLRPKTKEKVLYRGWAYKTDIIEDNVRQYNEELRGNVDYATVAGDYAALIEKQLAARGPIDVLYATPYQAVRYFLGGWIMPIDEFPNARIIKEAMDPRVRDAWTHKGKLLGLSYFTTARGVVQVNLKLYKELGFAEKDFPKTWDELYNQLYELRKKGVAQPFLPHWFGEWFGIPLAYIWEVYNRGGAIAHPETHRPLVTVDGPAGATLRAWKRIWNDGLVPREVLTYSEAPFMEAFASGRFVFSSQQGYDLMRFNDPRYSKMAGHVTLLPYQGQSWGHLETAMYQVTNRRRSPEHTRDVQRFAWWFGFRDHKGKHRVADRWIRESMLFSAYKPVMESKETERVIKGALARPEDYDVLMKVYQMAPYPKGVFNVVWAPEFSTWLREKMGDFLIKNEPVEATIKAMADKINELNRKYKVQ